MKTWSKKMVRTESAGVCGALLRSLNADDCRFVNRRDERSPALLIIL